MVNQEISQLLKFCKVLSQSRLAQDADVNRGQFNVWLKTGKNLADNKVVALIDALLAWLDDEGKDCKARYAAMIDNIKAYPPYQAVQANSFPMHPVPAGHPTYIERATESQLARLFESLPADVAVVGGPKMGKTSLMNWLQHHLCHKHHVLRCDFRNQPAAPLRAIEQTAKTAGRDGTRLRDWATFPDWVRHTLLPDAKPCTLILDHMEELTPDALQSLQDGLHHLVNQRRREKMLDRLNLVLGYDEAAPSLREAHYHSSGMVRDSRSLVLVRFDENQVEALLKSILQIVDDTELEHLVQYAWKFFRGHPFLTHLWADTLAEQKGQYDPEKGLQDIEEVACEHLFLPFAINLEEATCRAIHAAATQENGVIENVSAQARLWLQGSGLFDVNGVGAQASIEFASPWIHAQLASFLVKEGLNPP